MVGNKASQQTESNREQRNNDMMNTLNKVFRPYQLVDNYGTNKRFNTLKQATDWLPYAGTVAVIGKGGKVIMQRIQGVVL